MIRGWRYTKLSLARAIVRVVRVLHVVCTMHPFFSILCVPCAFLRPSFIFWHYRLLIYDFVLFCFELIVISRFCFVFVLFVVFALSLEL